MMKIWYLIEGKSIARHKGRISIITLIEHFLEGFVKLHRREYFYLLKCLNGAIPSRKYSFKAPSEIMTLH